jgi:ubiquinone biosynthesis protein
VIDKKRRSGIHYRHIGRYGEILSILVKYGFGDLLSRLNVQRYVRAGQKFFKVKRLEQLENISRWDRIRMAFEELGPTFIKLGQFAANRPDILPPELIVSLERLQDAVAPFSEESAVKIIEQELKKPLSSLFKSFERTPFASASIAQVHKAVLHDNSLVAVKIQRPAISEQISIDLEILNFIATLAQKHIPDLEPFNILQLVNEFSSALQKELDFAIELLHIQIFSGNFKDDQDVKIPEVYKNLSGKRVITTEFIHGIKISNVSSLVDNGLLPSDIARKGASAILKQIFIHGFFHADPHAGNILVTGTGQICFLDLGMTGILTQTSRNKLMEVVIGVVRNDPAHIVRVLQEFANNVIERKEDLEYEIAELMQEYGSRNLESINIGDLFNRLSRLLVIYRIRLIPGFYLLVKSLATLEGIGLTLDPQFNMMEHLEPFVRKMIRQQYSPGNIALEGFDTVRDYYYFLRDLPSEARDIIYMLKNGHVRIEFEHKGLEPVLKKVDQTVNRLVFSLVLASLVIGSSVVILSNIPPKIYGMPLIGIAGFLTAGVMAFSLLISIIRNERM